LEEIANSFRIREHIGRILNKKTAESVVCACVCVCVVCSGVAGPSTSLLLLL